MKFLLLPTHVPSPESMGQGDITVWTNWIHEESETIMKQMEEELEARGDPDDPFNGSANGIFQPLTENFTLSLLVQTPRRQVNNSESSDYSWKSPGRCNNQGNIRTVINGVPKMTAQGKTREAREHSTDSLDPMVSIQNLHIQQSKDCLRNQSRVEPNTDENSSIHECNLITFTPPHGQTTPQGAIAAQSESMKQRTPRERKQRIEQRAVDQVDQNKSQEISRISPNNQLNIFNTEESSVSYLQLPIKRQEERKCLRCGELGHLRRNCQAKTWCKFCTLEMQACRKYANFVRDNPITSSRRTTPVLQQETGQLTKMTRRRMGEVQQHQPLAQPQSFPQPPTQHF